MKLHPLPVIGMVAGVAGVSVAIGLIRSVIVIPNLSVLYLLVVMFSAVTWGWWNALGAAVLAFLAYDFFFTEPVHTFTIRDPEEWVALSIFMAVAAVASNLAARERARRQEARRQARTATLLYQVSRALGSDEIESGLRLVAECLISEFGLDGAVIELADSEARLEPRVVVGDAVPALGPRPAGRVFATSADRQRAGRWVIVRGGGAAGGASEPRAPVANFPLRRDDHQWGMLRLVGRPRGFADDETQVLATIADQVALALERQALRDEANQAEVLRRTDELRTALLNSVSHDLRTPLAAIKASAESLLQHDVPWTDEDREGFAAAIARESERLNRLVRNLLDMSRIEGGAIQPQREWYDLGEVVREVVARLGPTLGTSPLELVIPEELPPVPLDYLMIDQVITNLLENAVKYTPPGSPIRVEVQPADGRARVIVTDRGPGVPPGSRERVFDKFFRLDAKPGIRGSGLGLTVSRGLVEAHGGRVWVEDNPGGGARFFFELPAGEPRSPRVQAGSTTEGDARVGI
ncbi:MAG TPA: ATP-binding protein [Chloroflexota bacterium]|nr:ATP-binding protein [Chloroflexota bacterium]